MVSFLSKLTESLTTNVLAQAINYHGVDKCAKHNIVIKQAVIKCRQKETKEFPSPPSPLSTQGTSRAYGFVTCSSIKQKY